MVILNAGELHHRPDVAEKVGHLMAQKGNLNMATLVHCYNLGIAEGLPHQLDAYPLVHNN